MKKQQLTKKDRRIAINRKKAKRKLARQLNPLKSLESLSEAIQIGMMAQMAIALINRVIPSSGLPLSGLLPSGRPALDGDEGLETEDSILDSELIGE